MYEDRTFVEDTQEYVPLSEVRRGSNVKVSDVVLPSVMAIKPLISLSSGSNHFTVVGRSEITIQVKECLSPAGSGFSGPSMLTR